MSALMTLVHHAQGIIVTIGVVGSDLLTKLYELSQLLGHQLLFDGATGPAFLPITASSYHAQHRRAGALTGVFPLSRPVGIILIILQHCEVIFVLID